MNNILDGNTFLRMIMGGVANLSSHSKEVDDLNVFPVPDGDTGSNMTRTLLSGAENAKKVQENDVGKVAKELASGSLLGARGNSGVILSQIIKGIQTGIGNVQTIDAAGLINAYKKGVEQSYKAVVNPVEGTILTVFREAVEYAEKQITVNSTIEDFYKAHVEGVKISLPKTKEILPALKEADVIDSGGAGYLYIASGMYESLINPSYNPEQDSALTNLQDSKAALVDISAFTRDSELQFGYCTECLLRLQTAKVNPDTFDIQIIIDYLNSIGGESVVAYKEDDVVKLHVHTPNPGNVLNELRKYGEFLTVKIENMALQHQEIIKEKGEAKSESKEKLEHKKFGVVAVARGEGIKSTFEQVGADIIIDGGQTGNPPASDFIEAFERVNADEIFVLPNNSNILLTAKQAASMFTQSKVHVIPTKSFQQGYSALLVINPFYEDSSSIVNDVNEALDNVISFDVALAIKDANLQGKTILTGDYMGMCGDTILSVQKDKISSLIEMLKVSKEILDKEIITIFTGKDVTKEECKKVEQLISDEFKHLELTMINGEQEVYSFLVSVE